MSPWFVYKIDVLSTLFFNNTQLQIASCNLQMACCDAKCGAFPVNSGNLLYMSVFQLGSWILKRVKSICEFSTSVMETG